MEILFASSVGILCAAGIYLVLRLRTFPVIIGTSLLSYAVNIFLFATGRLVVDQPPILTDGVTQYTDPLPQALVLTAIVISFGMTAVVVMIALSAYLSADSDRVNEDLHPLAFTSDDDDGPPITFGAAVLRGEDNGDPTDPATEGSR